MRRLGYWQLHKWRLMTKKATPHLKLVTEKTKHPVMQFYVAAGALDGKNDEDAVFQYVHGDKGSAALIALAQNDDNVNATLLKRAPGVGKGQRGSNSIKLVANPQATTLPLMAIKT